MIGVSFGAPTEFRSNGRIIEGKLPWTADRVSGALRQDDLYVEMTFAAVMDKVGLDATTEQYGEAFRTSKYPLYHGNGAARRLLNQGVAAAQSGHPRYNIHANDIDFQIEADFIGLMTPGLPAETSRYCERVGRLMSHGDGFYGGLMTAAMYSAAFFETSVLEIVKQGLATIPEESGYARIIRDVIDLWKRYPSDWRRAWRELNAKWDKDDACSVQGALEDFNIDARLNGAYVVMGLLYGAGDFAATLEITTRLGQDSDCNPASAAGILGVVLGYSGIPDVYKAGIPALADTLFAYTEYSLNEITRSTVARALAVVERAGGNVTGDDILVPVQRPVVAALEQWDMGPAKSHLDASDSAWTFRGDWRNEAIWYGGGMALRKTSTQAGNEAILSFEGTAVALVGRMGQDAGRADVLLDGKAAGTIDGYVPERTTDNALWHAFGLAPGKHTLRIVTRADADSQSTGRRLEISYAVIYESR